MHCVAVVSPSMRALERLGTVRKEALKSLRNPSPFASTSHPQAENSEKYDKDKNESAPLGMLGPANEELHFRSRT